MDSSPSQAHNKTVLITGTSSGIGLATAALLAREGWTVFAGVRKQADFEKLQTLHSNIRPLILDVTEPEQIRSAIEVVRVAVGDSGLDGLVNNAGGSHIAPIEFMPAEDFEYGFQLNLIGVFRITQAAIPLLRSGAKPGRIINVSSIVGVGPAPQASGYSSAKHALEAFSSILRQELKSSGIAVSVFGAGPVYTNFVEVVRERLATFDQEFKDNAVYRCYYDKPAHGAVNFIDTLNRTVATTAEQCARQIKHMLETSWLRHRYCDSYVTWVTTCTYNWLPYWMTEWLTRILYNR